MKAFSVTEQVFSSNSSLGAVAIICSSHMKATVHS